MDLVLSAARLTHDLIEVKVRTPASSQRMVITQRQAERLLAELTVATIAPAPSVDLA